MSGFPMHVYVYVIYTYLCAYMCVIIYIYTCMCVLCIYTCIDIYIYMYRKPDTIHIPYVQYNITYHD